MGTPLIQYVYSRPPLLRSFTSSTQVGFSCSLSFHCECYPEAADTKAVHVYFLRKCSLLLCHFNSGRAEHLLVPPWLFIRMLLSNAQTKWGSAVWVNNVLRCDLSIVCTAGRAKVFVYAALRRFYHMHRALDSYPFKPQIDLAWPCK